MSTPSLSTRASTAIATSSDARGTSTTPGWGAFQRASAGQDVCGDVWVAFERMGARYFAVIDGVGHGAEANAAARRARRSLLESEEVAPTRMLSRLHQECRGTRGVAAIVVRMDGRHLTGCGAGHVGLAALGRPLRVPRAEGVLGLSVRGLSSFSCALRPRERVVLYSDGVRPGPWPTALRFPPPTEAALMLVEMRGRILDDATAVVIDAI